MHQESTSVRGKCVAYCRTSAATPRRLSTMPSRRSPASARLDVRLTPAHKELIEHAAAARGVTVSAFVVGTLVAEAEAAMTERTLRSLGPRDAKALLELLANPPEPSAALKRAARAMKASRAQ